VDMEGITGVAVFDETGKPDDDYDKFRKIMTEETNAAVEAAIEAGATEIVVKDAHGSARNILPDLLHKDAKLLRNWSDGPLLMMEGIDASFDAAMFVGYHAKAQTPNAPMKHTMSARTIADFRINGISMAEASLNALIAGMFDVPVIFISGDKAICDYSKSTFKKIETVAVKEGIGKAILSIHPDFTVKVRERPFL